MDNKPILSAKMRKFMLILVILVIAVEGVSYLEKNHKIKEIPTTLLEFENIDDLAAQLEIRTDIFEKHIETIGTNYDGYVKKLNNENVTIEQLKADTIKATGYEFSDYAQAMILTSNKAVPDLAVYEKIETGGSLAFDNLGNLTTADTNIDVYISKKGLENLSKNGIEISPAQAVSSDGGDASKAFSLYALMPYTGGEIAKFINGATEIFGCDSVELSNVNIFTGYDFERPGNENRMVADLFVERVDIRGKNTLYRAVTMPVITLKYANNDDNRSFGIVNSMGLVFTAKNADLLKKLSDEDFIDIQLRVK